MSYVVFRNGELEKKTTVRLSGYDDMPKAPLMFNSVSQARRYALRELLDWQDEREHKKKNLETSFGLVETPPPKFTVAVMTYEEVCKVNIEEVE